MSWFERTFGSNGTGPGAARPAGLLPGGGSAGPGGSTGSPGAAGDEAGAPVVDRELLAKRDRLIERFTVMQADLGGLFYEMAIRDHVRLDVLTRRAAELQRVDAELGQVERLLRTESTGATGTCPTCGALHARGAVFCWQCGNPLVAVDPVEDAP